MQTRYIIICLGILIIAQLVFFNYNQNETIKTLKIKNRQFDAHISTLEQQKKERQKSLDALVEVFKAVSPWMNTGFKDPENGFMKFLDFLDPELLDAVAAKASLAGVPTLEPRPIPLQKTNYSVTFDFNHPDQVESFLKALLLQQDYPLKVNTLIVKRGVQQHDTEENVVTGTLNIDLLLPANLMNINPEELKQMGVL